MKGKKRKVKEPPLSSPIANWLSEIGALRQRKVLIREEFL